jgi:hypothetical protein
MKKAIKPSPTKSVQNNPQRSKSSAKTTATKKPSSKPKPRKAQGQAELLQIVERLAQSAERLALAAERLAEVAVRPAQIAERHDEHRDELAGDLTAAGEGVEEIDVEVADATREE